MDAAASSDAQAAQAAELPPQRLSAVGHSAKQQNKPTRAADAAFQPQQQQHQHAAVTDAGAAFQQLQQQAFVGDADATVGQQQHQVRDADASVQQQHAAVRPAGAGTAQQQAVRQASIARQQIGIALGHTAVHSHTAGSLLQHDRASIASSRSSEAENRDSGKQVSVKQSAPVLRRVQSKSPSQAQQLTHNTTRCTLLPVELYEAVDSYIPEN